MQNTLKSIFISVLPILALITVIYSSIRLPGIGADVGNIGLLISGLPILLFFIFLFLFRRPRTSEYLGLYSLGVLAGVILSTFAFFMDHLDGVGWMASISLLFLWTLYLFWYSKFMNTNDSRKLAVDSDLPIFDLQSIDGEKIFSDSYQGRFAVFIFYRGNWCPLCVAQVKEIIAEYAELKQLSTQVILVSPQPHQYTQELAERFQVDFDFLVDENNQVAQQLGIAVENGIPFGFQALGYASDTVRPTAIVVSPQGKIIYSDISENYRLRPIPQDFIQIIRDYRT